MSKVASFGMNFIVLGCLGGNLWMGGRNMPRGQIRVHGVSIILITHLISIHVFMVLKSIFEFSLISIVRSKIVNGIIKMVKRLFGHLDYSKKIEITILRG